MLINKKTNCAIIGFGKMGLVYYNIIKKLNLNLVSVCDLKESNKKNLKKRTKNYLQKILIEF